MQRHIFVIASTLIVLLALSAGGFAQNNGSTSPGLAEQVAELEFELDEVQTWQLTTENSLGSLETSRRTFENATKDLEAQDRLGNFEIQRLASSFNQAETLLSNVQKKIDDTQNGTVSKIAALEFADDEQREGISGLIGRVDVLETLMGEGAVGPTDSRFLDIDGIAGEATQPGYEGMIQIEAWSWGATQTSTASSGSGAGAGKVNFQDLSISKRVDRSSPMLFLKCAQGAHFPEIVLATKRANGSGDYLVITLKDALITSYQTGGASSGDTMPTESISFNFQEIKVEYKPQMPDGTLGTPVAAHWNVATNTGGAG